MDTLGILHANQTSKCLDSHWYHETSLSPPVIFLLTIQRRCFFCRSFFGLSLPYCDVCFLQPSDGLS